MRGSGKSTLGAKLAYQLGTEFLDTDKEIERAEKRTIPEIIETDGWDYFRDIESKVARQMSFLDGHVIATGGGTVLKPENMAYLKANGVIIYLETSPAILAERIQDSDRPDLQKSLEELFNERQDLYEDYADLTFDVSDDNLVRKTQNLGTLVRTYLRG